MDTLAACGMVLAATDEDGPLYMTGSCFLFRSDRVAVTAAHCLPPDVMKAVIYLPRVGRTIVVEKVERHPEADIVIAFCKAEDTRSENGYPTLAFWDLVGNFILGEDLMAYGFPAIGDSIVDIPGDDVLKLYPPRLYKPYFQRLFNYVSPSGFKYGAGELSLPAPGGLSGSPLFRPGVPMVLGVVTANLESYAITDSIEEVEDGGKVFRLESRKVVSHGIALLLGEVKSWLDEYIPRPKR